MDAREYRRLGHASVSPFLWEPAGYDPVDLLACALWGMLDASGRDGAGIEVRTSAGFRRFWVFDATSAQTDVVRLLEQGPAAASPDTTPPEAVVRWSEHGAAGETESAHAAEVELTAVHRAGTVDLELAYTGLDRDIDIDALVATLARIFEELSVDANRPVASIPLVSSEQRTWLVDELNAVRMTYPEAPTVHALACEAAAASPESIAVVDGDEELTYAALVGRAQAVADRLRAAGARPGEAIAVMFRRGADCVASMLGVLLADGVYVPIPLEEPEARREQLLELVSARLLLEADGDTGGIRLTARSAEGSIVPGHATDDPGSPIYVMFTSGSTGRPKAVVVPHRAVIRLIRDPHFVGISRDHRIGFFSNPGFDAASWEVWGALCNGAQLVVAVDADFAQPDQLEALIGAHNITCLFLTTSLFNSHARTAPTIFERLRMLGIGGEAADPQACRRVLECGSPPRSLVNAYGPTETATFASWYEVTQVDEGTVRLPIGGPIVNTTLHVLDRHGRLVPPGMAGALFIGGDALALGYLGDPELTSQKFVPDPFAGPPHRLYASGDLVVRRSSGEIVYMGRLDEQLKIRGFRVEPKEVEAALLGLPGVSAAVVIGRVVDGYARLVAYVIVEPAGPDAVTIRRELRTQVPDHLVPSHVVAVDSFPLTRNGKLDRSRLPDPFTSPAKTSGSRLSRFDRADTVDDGVAAAIADIWCEVLGVVAVDENESFFDAGGDSLLAVRLYGGVQRRFGVVLPGGLVGEELTIGTFTAAVREALARAAPPIVVELSATEGPPVVFVEAGGGELYSYRWLVRALASRFHLFGVREPGHYGTEPRPRSAAKASEAIARALHDAGVEQPLAVVGECAGGVLAHNLACDLARDGQGPRLVALLEAPAPGDAREDDPQHGGAERLVEIVRRRGRDAVALAWMKTRWMWFRARRVPSPPALAHAMTLRVNARRLRDARATRFPGRLLYVHAVDDDGGTVTAGAAEYWTHHAATAGVVEAPGDHTGPDSYLSAARVGFTADALARELTLAAEGNRE